MDMLSEDELQRNLRAVEDAVAQQELEGLKVSASTIQDMLRAATGELAPEQVIRNIYSRYPCAQNVPIFEP